MVSKNQILCLCPHRVQLKMRLVLGDAPGEDDAKGRSPTTAGGDLSQIFIMDFFTNPVGCRGWRWRV